MTRQLSDPLVAAAQKDGPPKQGHSEMLPTAAELDQRIDGIEKWIDRAAESLLSFAMAPGEGAGFRRNTLNSSAQRPGCTSTSRSYLALHEYRRFLAEEERRPPSALDASLSATFDKWVMPLASEKKLQTRLRESENGENLFTKAHLLVALSVTPGVAGDLRLRDPEAVARALDASRQQLAADLTDGFKDEAAPGALGLQKEDPAKHNFLTLHALRALDISEVDVDFEEIRAQALRSVLDHLAYSSAGVLSRFDPGQLVTSATLLARLKAPDRERLINHSARVVAEVQTADGAWLSEQIVGSSELGRIFVSSYEVALCLTFLALHELGHGNTGFGASLLESFERTMRLVRATYVSADERDDQFRGWANDRSRWPGLVESWATASVLSFLLRYRELLMALRQAAVLARYGAARFDLSEEPDPWPDLERARMRQSELHTDPLDNYSDPTDDRELVSALTENLLSSALRQPGQRPERASLILYGDPGTRKTSLVRASAQALRWPMITLSPPDFLGEGGLEGFEAAAARIFEDLLRLRRVVVLFDECEDFFKPRRKSRRRGEVRPSDVSILERPESRTIGAFVTAGMLPRLQRLRDQRWVIFVLATNEDLEALDEAVRRPGRFDYAQRISDPTLKAQQRYVASHRRQISKKQRAVIKSVLKEWADSKRPDAWFAKGSSRDENQPSSGDAVPFAVIDYIVNTIQDFRLEGSPEDVRRLLGSRMEDVADPPDLVDGESRVR